MSNLFIGIDTSCYTTSICVADCNCKIIYENRKVLTVKKGKRGLRQSEAHFQHIANLPYMITDMKKHIDINDVTAVSYTDQPRYKEGSYMPVFTAGKAFAQTISTLLDVELYSFSHQEGHIRSGLYNQEDLLEKNEPFLCVHISGGTSEILKVTQIENRYITEVIGGALDISMGKLIDRIGVAMEIDFPCGKHIDDLSKKTTLNRKDRLPISVNEGYYNLSGIETKLLRKIETNNYNKSEISILILDVITRTLGKSLDNITKKFKLNKVLIVGGVASNTYLRDNLVSEINSTSKLIFSSKEHSTDNACGIALLGKDKYK